MTENGGLEILNIVTSVEDELKESIRFKAYPNPLKEETSFDMLLKQSSNVKLEIFDLNGRRVTTLLNERLPAGQHQLKWYSQNLRKGMYIVSFEMDGYKLHQKLIKE